MLSFFPFLLLSDLLLSKSILLLSNVGEITTDIELLCCRVGTLLERFKIALDCFFAIWFVVGNVWIFGGHSSSSEAPNLYRYVHNLEHLTIL